MAVKTDGAATKKDLDQVEDRLTRRIDQVEQGLSAKIDANSAKIDVNGAKIDANSAKIDQVEERLSARIDANGVKIEANGVKIDQVEQRLTSRLDKLTDYAIENRERVGKMLTEERFKVYFSELMSNVDGLARSVSRGEQERTATNARIDRMESDVEGLKAKLGT